MTGALEKDVLIGLGLAALSIAVSVGVGAVVVRGLPVDYLTPEGGHHGPVRPRAVQLLMAAGQNVIAVLLIFAGLVMSVPGVPGQGILTILVGVLLLRFPGKHDLERRVFARKRALRILNRFRTWLRCPPLLPPDAGERSAADLISSTHDA